MLHAEDGHVFFGRNFDYKHDACLILKVHGRDGPSSVAVLDLHYLNLDRDDLDQTSLIRAHAAFVRAVLLAGRHESIRRRRVRHDGRRASERPTIRRSRTSFIRSRCG